VGVQSVHCTKVSCGLQDGSSVWLEEVRAEAPACRLNPFVYLLLCVKQM
jgi:hypothetical protein